MYVLKWKIKQPVYKVIVVGCLLIQDTTYGDEDKSEEVCG